MVPMAARVGMQGGRMGRMKRLGEEGWDGVGDAHPQRALDHARRPWATQDHPCSEQGATGRLGTPSPNTSVSLGAVVDGHSGTSRTMLSSPKAGTVPVPSSVCLGSQRIWGFHREAQGSVLPPSKHQGWCPGAEPGCPRLASPTETCLP